MDREPEELQFLGFVGIYNEAYKITASCWKIFLRITLAFILPLSFIYLTQIEISNLFFPKITHKQEDGLFSWFADYLTSEYTDFWVFKFMYHIFLLFLTLPSTSAVVYTIACIYTTKEVTFNKVAGVVPTVWKRLMITFVWTLIIMFLYDVFTFLVLNMLFFVAWISNNFLTGRAWDILVFIMIILYAIGFVYIRVIWHLASVLSLLEESYGYKAFRKSKALIKGKMWIASVIFVMIQNSFMIILVGFEKLVAHGRIGVAEKVCFGILCLLLLSILIHFAFVIQTVVYFVCKSYHHESIDKFCLGEHLEAYNLGDYVPPIGNKDIQLEQYDGLIESTP